MDPSSSAQPFNCSCRTDNAIKNHWNSYLARKAPGAQRDLPDTSPPTEESASREGRKGAAAPSPSTKRVSQQWEGDRNLHKKIRGEPPGLQVGATRGGAKEPGWSAIVIAWQEIAGSRKLNNSVVKRGLAQVVPHRNADCFPASSVGNDDASPSTPFDVFSPHVSDPQSSSSPPRGSSAGIPPPSPFYTHTSGHPPQSSSFASLPPRSESTSPEVEFPSRRPFSSASDLASPQGFPWGGAHLSHGLRFVQPIRPQALRCQPESAALASVVMQFLPTFGAAPLPSESDSSGEPADGGARRGELKEHVIAEYLKLTTAMAKATAGPPPSYALANSGPTPSGFPHLPPFATHPGIRLSPPNLPKSASTSHMANLDLEPQRGFRKPRLDVLATPSAFAALSLASPCGPPPAEEGPSKRGQRGKRCSPRRMGGSGMAEEEEEAGMDSRDEDEQEERPRLKGGFLTENRGQLECFRRSKPLKLRGIFQHFAHLARDFSLFTVETLK